ncbi:MAG TPA: hypothetical protein VK826_18715 [Bacteroidia bacterium]|nr:hypothetical protein [Bacteroidia bacterium]
MTWRRIKLYLIGVGLGLLLCLVLFRGRTFDSCSPQSRVTAQIASIKTIEIDSTLGKKMLAINLPADTLRARISRGDVDFSRSQAQKEPCHEYLVKFDHAGKHLEAYVAVCAYDSTAKLLYLEGM